MTIKYENGKTIYSESINLKYGYLVVALHQSMDVGSCLCCGKETYISYGDNIIFLSCHNPDGNVIGDGIKCKFDDICPGMDKCVNKDKFKKGRIENNEKILLKIACSMLRHYGSFMINDSTESRYLVANHFMKDKIFSISNVTAEKAYGGKDVDFIIVEYNDTILKNRSLIDEDYHSIVTTFTEDEIDLEEENEEARKKAKKEAKKNSPNQTKLF